MVLLACVPLCSVGVLLPHEVRWCTGVSLSSEHLRPDAFNLLQAGSRISSVGRGL